MQRDQGTFVLKHLDVLTPLTRNSLPNIVKRGGGVVYPKISVFIFDKVTLQPVMILEIRRGNR